MMQQLGTADLQGALEVLGAIADGTAARGDSSRHGVANLPRLLPAELTTLRECLEAIRPHLSTLYQLTRKAEGARSAWGVPAPLTAREREVLRWLAGGKTDRDIACILGISPRTVQKHLQRMYEKLGVETRTAAVTRALGYLRA